ncbi:hypothetical protein FE840_011870 [Peteryoungia desertarenae]|uniref:Uncharacterized protein n=1 Tax=Peteryoungia desertarenae TaxID=1813451 RepID=A0ABX6QNU8_9HYPH|nr:hypothetical protein [Peteryoungia desertarenae]QLF70179.1 hypothetical protein FE840_011870 [Peteryoungia desertarenae]
MNTYGKPCAAIDCAQLNVPGKRKFRVWEREVGQPKKGRAPLHYNRRKVNYRHKINIFMFYTFTIGESPIRSQNNKPTNRHAIPNRDKRKMTNTKRPVAANDNTPRDAGEFATLADRRAWLATLPDKAAPVMAWPTLERLARLPSPSAAAALWRYAKLMDPHKFPTADNDNDPDAADLDCELRHEVRPTVKELMAAAGRPARVVYQVDAVGWSIIRKSWKPHCTASGVELGSLTFRNGKLVSWGKTTKGKDLKPVERQRMPKGAASSARLESDIRFLLSSKAPIAKGAFFFGGKKGKKGTGTQPDIGDHAAAEELARNQHRQAVRLALGEKVWILDAAITDATAREIGELMGFTGKTAERRGIAAINDAIAAFEKIAA